MSAPMSDTLTMQRALGDAVITQLTDRIEAAQTQARAIPKLTEDFPAMTLGDAYAVQLQLLRRWEAQGRRQVGWKRSEEHV